MAIKEEALYAVANWWADKLPGAKGISKQEIDNIGGSPQMLVATMLKDDARQREGFVVTADQYYAFIEALVTELKNSELEGFRAGGKYLQLSTDYNPDAKLSAALRAAGIYNDLMSLPWKTGTTVQEDGRVFVPGTGGLVPLDYEGAPTTPYKNLYSIDFNESSYGRIESLYLTREVAAGETVKSVLNYRWGPEYNERTVEKDSVLVVPGYAAKNFNELTQETLLDVQAEPSITFAYVSDKEEYADGAEKFGETREKLNDKGLVRGLGEIARIKKLTESFTCGSGSEYKMALPGDYVFETESYGRRQVKLFPKAGFDAGNVSLLACDKDGKLTGQTIAAPLNALGRTPS